jgi:hypothetical protein
VGVLFSLRWTCGRVEEKGRERLEQSFTEILCLVDASGRTNITHTHTAALVNSLSHTTIIKSQQGRKLCLQCRLFFVASPPLRRPHARSNV